MQSGDATSGTDTTHLIASYPAQFTHCDSTGRFTFTATTVSIGSSCKPTASGTYTYSAATKLLTVTASDGGTGTIAIENLTATGFKWDQLEETGYRYTLQLIGD